MRLASLGVFDSLVVCHPGFVSEAEVKAINVGTLVLLFMVRAYRYFVFRSLLLGCVPKVSVFDEERQLMLTS